MARSTIRVPYYVMSLANVAYNAVSTLQDRISSSATEFLRRKKLITASSSRLPSLRSDSSSTLKALGRISKILNREAFKVAPYLKHLSSAGGDSDLISVERRGLSLELTGMSIAVNGSRLGRVFHRYARYLNYLSAKNGLPLRVQSITMTPRAIEGVDAVSVAVTKLRLMVNPVLPYISGTLVDEGELQRLRSQLEESGADPDQVYRQRNNPVDIVWTSLNPNVFWSNSNNEEPGAPAKSLTPELLVLHIPGIIKSIVTISRKLSYEYSAFTVGTADL